MESTQLPRYESHVVDTLLTQQPALWVGAIALYGIGDVGTTIYFITTMGLVEGHPVVAAAIDAAGLWILVPWKVAAIGLFYGLARVVPRPYGVGVPIGLCVLGAILTGWNLYLGLVIAPSL